MGLFFIKGGKWRKDIRVIDLREARGSCNYCEGEYREDGMGLKYNYDKVIEVRGIEITTRFCPKCFKKFQDHKLK